MSPGERYVQNRHRVQKLIEMVQANLERHDLERYHRERPTWGAAGDLSRAAEHLEAAAQALDLG